MRFQFSYIRIIFLFAMLFCVCGFQNSYAQQQRYQITVFAPVYLDDAFDGNTFKIWDNRFPKNMLPGLEFYNGVILAIDSLKKVGDCGNLTIKIYDYKSKGNSLNEIITKDSSLLQQSSVIIASFNNRSEIKILADYAKDKNIPLISATYPNDGGISNNSNFFLLNSTLFTHCKAVYGYLKRINTSGSNLLCYTRSGSFEDMVNGYFEEFDSLNKNKLHFTPKVLVDTFYSSQIVKSLDSNKQNIIFISSTNEAFILRVANAVAQQKKYKVSIIGLPTWESIKSFDKSSFKDVEFVYTTSFNYSKNNTLVADVSKQFFDKYAAKPSDMVYKGYEVMLRFGKVVSKYGNSGIQLFGDNMFKVINNLDIQPVYNKSNQSQVDYYENQKVYFIKKLNGVSTVE